MTETLQLGQLSETCVLNQAHYIFITVKQKNNNKQHNLIKKRKKRKTFSSNLSALYKQRTLSNHLNSHYPTNNETNSGLSTTKPNKKPTSASRRLQKASALSKTDV